MSDQGPVRILIIEDHEELRDSLVEVLEDEGYEVVATSRGEEAVTSAGRMGFDLVIADIRMEGMDGLEALQHVKEFQPHVGSLVITGYSTEADSIRAIRVGVQDYLKKPFQLSDLLDRVNQLAGQHRREQLRSSGESAWRDTALWALWSLAQAVDVRLQQAGIVASWLAREVNLSARDDTVLATLLAGLGRLGRSQQLPTSIPPGARDVLDSLEERWDGSGPRGLVGQSIPLGARVAAAALEAALAPEPLQAPGVQDPLLLQLLERYEPGAAPTSPPRSGHRERGGTQRGLLSLARALEEVGDRASAERAYLQLAASPDRRAQVQAGLGLARLRLSPGDTAGALQRLTEAARLARQLDAPARAQALLECGLLLAEPDPEAARELLDQAVQAGREARDPAAGARATLALAGLAAEPRGGTEAALAVLMQPEYTPDLVDSAGWLTRLLLEHPGEPQRACLQRLAREAPRELERCLERGLGPIGRRTLLELLSSVSWAPEEILRKLAGDSDPEVSRQAHQLRSRLGRPNAPPLLRVYSLGALEVYRGDERVPESAWKTAKTRFLFAFLAANEGRSVPEDRAIDLFWPEDASKGRRSLNTALSTLRQCLRPSNWPGELDYLQRTTGQLGLNPELERWHDVEELERAAAEGQRLRARGQLTEAQNSLRRAVMLYRGPYLEECYMDWAVPIRSRLEELVSEACTFLAAQALREGRARESLDVARRLVELDPIRQEAHLAVISAQLSLGQYEDAVRQFETCRRVLRRELGMEPSLELLEACERARISLSLAVPLQDP